MNGPIILSIDGNIGSGKSTLYKDLQDYYSGNTNIGFCPEPVDNWGSVIDKEGVPILTNLYKDTKKYAFRFQMMAYISRLHLLKNIIKKNNYRVIICERSVQTDKNVFAKMLYDDNMIEHDEYQIYTMWFNEFLDELKLGGIIYVNANPKICFDRVKIRNREGENIPLEYLQKCHDYHESWLSSIENKLTIEANIDTSLSENKNKRNDWVETIDEWISNELYKNESQLKENNSNNYPILRFDGACRGNPSDVIGIGCIIYNETSTLCQKSEHYLMPDKGTNNVAEYKALIGGLEMAKENSITKINIQGDSQLIINQMTGVYKVKAENLIPLYEKAKQLETYFDKINYSHIKREFNKAADKLANLALDKICSGCYPIYQPNQEGHMGINGCLSNDDDD